MSDTESTEQALVTVARQIAEMTDWPHEALANDLALLDVYGDMAKFYVWHVMRPRRWQLLAAA